MRFASTAARLALVVIALVILDLPGQEPISPTAKIVLKDKEKCGEGQTCVCGSPPIDVEVGCECQIDSLGGTGTQHCPLGKAGTNPVSGSLNPVSNPVIAGILGLLIGSGLTFLATRRRG